MAAAERTIAVHVGLPKTGSSALQRLLYDRRGELARRGIVYPDEVQSEAVPKHQLLAQALLGEDFAPVEAMLRRHHAAERIVLSTESISNELYHVSETALRRMADLLSADRRLELILVTRAVDDWGKSYYKQAVINQSSKRMPFYSTSQTYAEFVHQPVVALLSDHGRLVAFLERAVHTDVRRFDYDETTVADIANACVGSATFADSATSMRNESLPDVAVELMRQLNGTIATRQGKYAWTWLLVEALGVKHATARNLAGRAGPASVAKLDLDVLRGVRWIENPPLSVARHELPALIEAMRSTYRATVGAGFPHRGVPSSNLPKPASER